MQNQLIEFKKILRRKLADKQRQNNDGGVALYIYQVNDLEEFVVEVFNKGIKYGREKARLEILKKVRDIKIN